MKKLIVLLLLLVGFGSAQECKTLLKDMYPDRGKEFSTMEMTMNTQMNVSGMDISTESYTVIDRDNRRIYSKTITKGMTMIMIIQNGDFTMSMQMPDGSTMPIPAMPAMEKQLNSIFDNAFNQSGIPQDYNVISCDGMVSISDIMSGEQITVLAKMPKIDPAAGEDAELEWEEKEMKFVVDKNSGLIGMFMTIEQFGQTFLVVKSEVGSDGYIQNMEIKMYKVDGDNYQLFSTSTMTYGKFNQPIDESLFTGNAASN